MKDLESKEFFEGFEFHKSYWKDKHYDRFVDQLIEEMSELTKILLKERRGRKVQEEIKGEVGDVLLCLKYLFENKGYKLEDFKEQVNWKSNRMVEALKRGKH